MEEELTIIGSFLWKIAPEAKYLALLFFDKVLKNKPLENQVGCVSHINFS